MDITQIKERLEVIGSRLVEINKEQISSGLELARYQGTENLFGINIAPLTDWARKMRDLNTEIAQLTQERKELKALRRDLKTCVCNCH